VLNVTSNNAKKKIIVQCALMTWWFCQAEVDVDMLASKAQDH